MYHRLHLAALACAVACGVAACAAAATPGQAPSTQPAASAQPPEDVPAPPPAIEAPLPTASVSGRVTSQADNRPLGRARVVLGSPATAEARVAITGPDGVYRFDRLRPGTYSVSVTRTGFAPAQYGERRSVPAILVAVSDGQAVTGIDVPLLTAGVIVGQILDEDERPFTGATVEALVPRTTDGRTLFIALAAAQTDDRGEFRLAGLPAGRYYVSAFDPAFAAAVDETGPLRYTPTYYPGVAVPEEASPVVVTPGVEPDRKLVFRLRIVRPARVTGRIRAQDGRELTSGAVVMAPARGDGVATVPSHDVSILADGSFSFRNVPPGLYLIRARGDVERDDFTRFATFRVRVEGRDIERLDLMLVPGATVQGRIVVEAERRTPPPQWAGIRVRAPFADGTSFGDTLDGQVQPDGTYRIGGLMSGRHLFSLEGLPHPWMVKDIAWRGQDIADTGLETESEHRYTDVRFTITDVAAEIAGIVRGPNAAPAPGAIVLIIPSASQFWHKTSRRFALVRSDAGGQFIVRGLPPGEYRAVASHDIDEREAYRTDVVKHLASIGQPVSVAAHAALKLELPLTSFVPSTRVAAR